MANLPGAIEFSGIRIGKGLRPITQSGKLVIDEGVLTLYNPKGGVVASAPIGSSHMLHSA